MVSSATVPFKDRVKTIDGVKYVPVDFYLRTLQQRDELIEEQRTTINKLKQKVNKYLQRAKL